MARRTGSENDLIKCEYCGELYAASYKHCPFCNEDGTGRWDDLEEGYDDYEEEEPRRGGGKRLEGGRGGGRSGRGDRGGGPSVGRIIGTVLSLALIVAAVCILVSIARSLIGGKKPPAESTQPTAPVESPIPESQTPSGVPTDSPEVTDPPVQPTVPSVEVKAPTDFKLNASDLTFDTAGQIYDMRAIFTPADASAQVSWTSSNPNVAAVSWNGRVTAVGKGTCTITGTVEGLGSKECIFRCSFKDSGSSTANPSTSTAPNNSSAPSGNLTLSREDFTLAFAGDKWQLKVSGTSSAVTWASSNANVATVAADGTVTAVGKGTCNVTATVDGVTLKCIVRCTWKD